MKKHLCKMSQIGECKYAGNKCYNYGFVSGSASYCRFSKKWVADLKECPNKPLSQIDDQAECQA